MISETKDHKGATSNKEQVQKQLNNSGMWFRRWASPGRLGHEMIRTDSRAYIPVT